MGYAPHSNPTTHQTKSSSMAYSLKKSSFTDSTHSLKVREILERYAHEFVPPLFSRQSSVQTSFLDNDMQNRGIADYFTVMSSQHLLVAEFKETVIGFLSYRNDDFPKPLAGHAPLSYVTTIIIETAHRSRGVCTKLYSLLEKVECNRAIATRTWSENNEHISIIDRLGFGSISKIPNDRGKGIDTIYFLKRTSSSR